VPGIKLFAEYTECFGARTNPTAVKGCLIYKGEENSPPYFTLERTLRKSTHTFAC